MISELEAREQIVTYSHKVQNYGFVSATDGNLSVRLDEERVLITPSGLPKGDMTLDAPIIVDMEGNKIAGEGKPSSEGKMHVEVYRLRKDIRAVIHAHPPKCIAFTVAGVPLDTCLLPEVVVTLGPVPTSRYATPTTDEVPASIKDLITKSDAVMLSRHGSLTVGKDLNTAFKILEKMEHTAGIAIYARILGGPQPFSSEELRKLYELRDKWGVEKAVPSCYSEQGCSSGNIAPTIPTDVYEGPTGGTIGENGGKSNGNGDAGGSDLDIDFDSLVDIIVEKVKQSQNTETGR